jgi:peroxiredoxin
MKAQGVEVLAVSEDEKRKELDAFLAELQPAFAVVTDPNGSAASSFKVVAIPSMYVIDRDGTIRFSHPNYSIDVLEVVRGEIAALASIPQLHNSATSN